MYKDHIPTGPPHEPIFTTTCEVVVDGFLHRSKGTGNNKKDSKQAAAAAVLKSLQRATPSEAPSQVRSTGRARTEFSPILDNLSSQFGSVGITQNRSSVSRNVDPVVIKKETSIVSNDLKAENQKLKKEVAKLQKQLEKIRLTLTEPCSDEEDDE